MQEKVQKASEEMTAREFLSRYRDLGLSIESKLHRIRELKDQAVRVSSTLSSDRVQTSTQGDRVSHAVSLLLDTIHELEHCIGQRRRAMQEIETAIEQVEDEKQRNVLRQRYLSGLPLGQIAEEAGYSRMQISRIHGKGLETVEGLLKKILRKQRIGEGKNHDMPIAGKMPVR